MRRSALRLLPGSGEPVVERAPHPVGSAGRTRRDEEMTEDAASRHEQFTEEGDRWRDDRPGERT